MRFSIVTPSFGQLAFLRLNAASVEAQRAEGVDLEHIVQDGGSKDGTREWLAQQHRIIGVAEKDDGMYDAINRGIEKGSGDVFAWLNCDEQYLPGALKAVERFFERHPNVDIAVGHTVIVDPAGNYICHRKAVVPSKGILKLGRLPVHSSSMFFRRRTVHGDRAVRFDPQWKAMGDWAWMKALVDQGARIAVVDAFISTFVDTGGNLGMSPRAKEEADRVRSALTSMDRLVEPVTRGMDYLRKLAGGYYQQAPFDYSMFLPKGDGMERTTFRAEKPTFIWKGHMFGQ